MQLILRLGRTSRLSRKNSFSGKFWNICPFFLFFFLVRSAKTARQLLTVDCYSKIFFKICSPIWFCHLETVTKLTECKLWTNQQHEEAAVHLAPICIIGSLKSRKMKKHQAQQSVCHTAVDFMFMLGINYHSISSQEIIVYSENASVKTTAMFQCCF